MTNPSSTTFNTYPAQGGQATALPAVQAVSVQNQYTQNISQQGSAQVVPGPDADMASASLQLILLQTIQALQAVVQYCDTTAVTIAGGQVQATLVGTPSVNAQVTGAVACTSQPLPPNASQESGGNLDQHTANLVALNQSVQTTNATMGLVLQQLAQITALMGGTSIAYQ